MKIFFLVIFLLPAGLFARPASTPYDMIHAGDPILEDLRFLSLETARPFLSFTPPLPPHNIKRFLNSIDTSTLSAPALQAFERVERRLYQERPLSLSFDHFSVSLNINSTIEARARLNENILWYPLHPQIPAVLSLPVRMNFFSFLQLYIDPAVRKLPGYYLDAGRFGMNASLRPLDFDARFPHRAFLAAGGRWWNFQIGRDRLSYGTGRMGNLVLSDNSEYYDFLRFSFFSRVFKYSSLIIHTPLEITDSLHVIQNPASLRNSVHRYFYLHRFDINLFDVVSISFMEGLMAGNSPLAIRYLNPMMIFHSLFSGYDYGTWADTEHLTHSKLSGSIMGLELNWNIMRNLAFHSQFVMNQFALPGERRARIQPPNGLGFMAGLQYSHSFNVWASSFFFEFAGTSPFLYISSSPFASFIHMRNDPSSPDGKLYSFFGLPRDSMVFTLGARFFRDDIMQFSGIFSVQLQGEHGIRYDFEISEAAFNRRAPSGVAQQNYILSISAQRRLSPLFSISGSITGIFSRNNNHSPGSNETGLQASLAVSFSY